MKNYKKIILNSLLDKYEKSSLYREDNRVNVNIAFKFNRKTIADYYNEKDYILKQEINELSMNLEEKGFVIIHWKKFQEGNIIDKLQLNIDKLNEIYSFLNRSPKNELEENARNIISKYSKRDDWLGKFALDMFSRLNQKKSIKKYLDIEKIKVIKDILYAIEKMLKQQEEIPKRVFSIGLFSDSKRFESLESKIIRIMKDYGEYEDDIDVLAEENIVNNPGYVYLKGSGTFKCNFEVIDLEKIKDAIGLSTNIIKSLEIESLNIKRVLTIENLTTFHCYIPIDELVIYLGGYHNAIRRRILNKIYEYDKDMQFYHWGDIDLGGLRILNHLRNKTKIQFKPYRMDKGTIETYQHHTKPIQSDAYIRKLKDLLVQEEYREFYEVINYMIKHQVTLEQEALDIK
jgi:hypothetical protein